RSTIPASAPWALVRRGRLGAWNHELALDLHGDRTVEERDRHDQPVDTSVEQIRTFNARPAAGADAHPAARRRRRPGCDRSSGSGNAADRFDLDAVERRELVVRPDDSDDSGSRHDRCANVHAELAKKMTGKKRPLEPRRLRSTSSTDPISGKT